MNARSVTVLDARPGSRAALLGLLLWHRAAGSGHVLVHLDPFGLSDGLMKTFSLVHAEQQPMEGSDQAFITDACLGCGSCALLCRFGAVQRTRLIGNSPSHRTPWHIAPLNCIGCGVCARFCPSNAIVMRRPPIGTLQISRRPEAGITAVSMHLESGRDITGCIAAQAIREGRNRRGGADANLFVAGLSVTSPAASAVCAETEVLIFTIFPGPGAERFLDRAAEIAIGAGRRAWVVVIDSAGSPERIQAMEAHSRAAGLEPAGHLPSCDAWRAAEMRGVNVEHLFSDPGLAILLNNIFNRILQTV